MPQAHSHQHWLHLSRLCALLLMWMTACPLQALAGQVRPVPSFNVQTLDGRTLSSSSLAGKVVIVNIWATWCEPCRDELPAFAAFYRQHQRDGLEIIAISMDDASDRKNVEQVAAGLPFPVAMLDSTKLKGFGRLWRVPLTFVIGRDGALRRDGQIAAPTMDAATLDAQVLPLLGETSGTQ